MSEGKKADKQLFGRLAERMKRSKRFELAVYASLIGMAVLLYVFALGGDGGAKRADNSASGIEARLEQVLSEIRGVGEVRVMVVQNESSSGSDGGAGSVSGVIVVAEGASDMAVKMALIYAVRAALGIEQSRIEIFEMR